MAQDDFQELAPVRISAPWQLDIIDSALLASVPGKQHIVPVTRPMLIAILQKLHLEGKTIAELESEIQKSDSAGLDEFWGCIDFFKKNLLLGWEWRINGCLVGVVAPLSAAFHLEHKKTDPAKKYVFSRFALLRLDAITWVLESPLLFCRLQVEAPMLLLLVQVFSKPQTCAEALAQVPVPSESLIHWLNMLFSLGFLERALEESEAKTPEMTALQLWEFHDLYFHSRTRLGRHNNPVGRAPRFEEIQAPPPFKPHDNQAFIFLPKLDEKLVKEKEITLFEAMELRKSNRHHGQPAINLKEIGEFLFRVARVKGMYPNGEDTVTQRPYPNAGASYEIEFYLLVRDCIGLPEGFYRYDPIEHGLVQIQQKSEATDALYAASNYNHKPDFAPQTIIFLSARFARNSWKYQTLSYVNTLKHVGVLFQSMYLVATAMGLAPNGWSTGNSDLFNSVSGTNYYEESSVGEFLLGATG